MKNINSKSVRKIESECLNGKNGHEILTMIVHKEHKFFEGEGLLHIETGKWELVFDFLDITDSLENGGGEHETWVKVCIFDTFDECLKVYNRELEYYENQGKVSEWVEKETRYVSPWSSDIYL
jgi:hypothetical protein